jgi:DNA-binding transcriptional LysR family regulator
MRDISKRNNASVDLRLLNAFVTVAREGSLTRAATELHMTQPAVSLQIKSLQSSLGLTLFSRTSRGLALTRDGQALLPHAQRAVATANEVRRAAMAMRSEKGGRLAIGTILDPGFLRLGQFLKSIVENYPRIETTLRHGMSGWILEQVRLQEIDIGYYIQGAEEAIEPHFHAIPLTQFQYIVLAPPGWQGRIRQSAPNGDWAELATLPWIGTPAASAHSRLLSRRFAHAGVKPFTVAEVDQESSMLELVKSGVGLSLARRSTALVEAHEHGLTIVEGAVVDASLMLITRNDRREEPNIATAFQLIEQLWA